MIPRYQTDAMAKIWSDAAKFACWFDVEIAHVEARDFANHAMLLKQKHAEINWDNFVVDLSEHEKYLKHDVIAFLKTLEDLLGDDAREIHRGLTSSDIVDTAFALQLKNAGTHIQKNLRLLLQALWHQAQQARGKLCLGRTHGQAAQVTTFGIKLLGFISEFVRDYERLDHAIKNISFGKLSGAVGNYAYSSPEIEQKALALLGLQAEPVATQIVARDRHAEYFMSLAILAGSLERLALELRLLSHGNIREAAEFFSSKQQGSSAMPHKKNPVLCENISGLMRLVRSYALASLENQALWHERDISHSSVERIAAPDATMLIDFALTRMTTIIKYFMLDFEHMKAHIKEAGSSLLSQAILIALMDKGLGRSEAYMLVQKAALSSQRDFKQALIKAGIYNFLSEPELDIIITHELVINSEDILFKRIETMLDKIAL